MFTRQVSAIATPRPSAATFQVAFGTTPSTKLPTTLRTRSTVFVTRIANTVATPTTSVVAPSITAHLLPCRVRSSDRTALRRLRRFVEGRGLERRPDRAGELSRADILAEAAGDDPHRARHRPRYPPGPSVAVPGLHARIGD